jgi:hypothetical protein
MNVSVEERQREREREVHQPTNHKKKYCTVGKKRTDNVQHQLQQLAAASGSI